MSDENPTPNQPDNPSDSDPEVQSSEPVNPQTQHNQTPPMNSKK